MSNVGAYTFLRNTILIVPICIAILIFVKTKSLQKSKRYIVRIFVIVMYLAFAFFLTSFPFENLFITFDSPQEVYKYQYKDESEIKTILNGNSSDLIIADNEGANLFIIVPKTENGWKIGRGADLKRVAIKYSDRITVIMYQYKHTNDYFVSIHDRSGKASQIEDNCNSKFYPFGIKVDAVNETFYDYYAYVSDFDSQYWISVNGKKIITFD